MANMNSTQAEQLARQFLGGQLSLEQFRTQVGAASGSIAGVTLDLERQQRCGFPEVVYGEGKTVEVIAAVLERQQAAEQAGLVTRLDPAAAPTLLQMFPQGHHNALGRTFRLPAPATSGSATTIGRVVVVTAGTTDLPVAEEARETLLWMGVETELLSDIGVAGPHRLLAQVHKLRAADAIVVAAGMEGALPSVVGGHVACPVIGVPTSVGYGANLGGMAALLSMLNSCAANVTVVNVDAGFKAGYIAGLIAWRVARHET
jgi:NCAIR mutase (PurE)-related protein